MGLAGAGVKGGRKKTHFDVGLISVRLIRSDELSSADKPLRESTWAGRDAESAIVKRT